MLSLLILPLRPLLECSEPCALAESFAVSPGNWPDPDRLAISARTAPSHLNSSSSLGAHNNSVRLVVTILNICPW